MGKYKSKSNKQFMGVVIFFLVSFLMGFAFGLFTYHKAFNKPPKKSNTNEVSNNTIITDKNIINDLFDQINNKTFEKVLYTYRLNGVKFKELTNDEKLYLADIDKYTKQSVKYSELKNNLLTKYNTDFDVKNNDYNYHNIETIKCTNDEYIYPDSILDYVDSNPYIDLYKTLELVKKDNKYYLSVVGIYHQITTNEDKYSNDTGFVYNEALSNKTTIDDLYKTNKEQFMLYTFIFNKNNDKYVIEQVKKEK